MNFRMLAASGLVTVSAVSVLCFAFETDKAAPAAKLPDFSDKVLLVYLSPETAYPTYIMADSGLCEIGNRLFLAGKFADTRRKEDWRSGIETYVAWDAVKIYQVLTAEQYEKFLDDAHAGS